jgi:CRP/FNR family transcriptional regulator, cyclic AMP receptor protein
LATRTDRSRNSLYVVDNIGKYQQELSLLLSGCNIRRYPANAVIYRKGDVKGCFYFIRKGLVRFIMAGSDGLEKIIAFQEKNTFFGETDLFGYPYVASAVTTEETELSVIEQAHFESCVRKNPAVSFVIIESLVRKLQNFAIHLEDLSLLRARGRIAHILLRLAEEIGVATSDGIVLQKKFTHETLADLTGLARPTLTALLCDLQRSSVIRRRNHEIVITDREGLLDMTANIQV